jgi:hypothetical protein
MVAPSRKSCLSYFYSKARIYRFAASPSPILKGGHIEGAGIAQSFSRSLCVTKRTDAGFMLLQQPQARAHDIAGRSITARTHLFANELTEMIADRDGGITPHDALLLAESGEYTQKWYIAMDATGYPLDIF